MAGQNNSLDNAHSRVDGVRLNPTTSHLPWDRDEVQHQHQLPLQQRRGESNSCDRPFGASSHNILFVSSSDSTAADKWFRQQHPTTLHLCRFSTPTSSLSGGEMLGSSNDSSTPSETAPCNFLQQVDIRITQPSRDSQQHRKHPWILQVVDCTSCVCTPPECLGRRSHRIVRKYLLALHHIRSSITDTNQNSERTLYTRDSGPQCLTNRPTSSIQAC